jgi:hypothetical protein
LSANRSRPSPVKVTRRKVGLRRRVARTSTGKNRHAVTFVLSLLVRYA